MKNSISTLWSKTSFQLCFLSLFSILLLGNSSAYAQCANFDASADVTICAGESTTLTASGAFIYDWAPNQGLSANTGARVTAAPLTTTTYTVTGTTLFGCVDSKTITVTVNARPVITITGNTTICNGSSTTLTAAGASNYTWAPGIALNTTTGATVIANPTNTITYVVTGTSTDGCEGNGFVTVNVVDKPEVGITGVDAICEGDVTPLSASGADSYSWSPAAGLSSTTDANILASPTVTTTYTVVGTTATGGCTDTATITIVVNPAPTITITGNTTICPGGNTTLTASGAEGFVWGPVTALNTTVGATIIAAPTTTTTYTVTGTDPATGCEGSQTITVVVDSVTEITVTGKMTICLGDSTILTAAGANSYEWGPAAGLSATTGNPVTANPTETTTYSVMGTTTGGCVGTTAFTITVVDQPTITVTGNTNLCQGDSTLLTAAGAETYSWSPATGLSSTTDASVIASPTATSTYIVTGTNAAGCVGTDTVTVIVTAAPTITITGDTTICPGETTTLTASGADGFIWGPATALNTTVGATIIAAPAQTTTFTANGTDAATGCTGTQTITVTVLPTPVITVTGDSLICIGESTTLTANGASSYTWDPAISLDTTAGATVIASPIITTTYIVTGVSADGCIGNGGTTIVVTPQPVVEVVGNPFICDGDTTLLTAIGADTYVWSPGTGLSATTDATVMASPSTTTTYDVIGTSAAGCSDTTQVTVTVLPSPTITITGDTTICPGETTELTAAGATAYIWGPATALNTIVGETVIAAPAETTTITVAGTDSVSGCVSTASITITVLPTPEITVEGVKEICEGESTMLIANGAKTYEWTPAATLDTASGPVVTASPENTTTYIITGTSEEGCVGAALVTVTVFPKPVIAVIGNNIICEGDSTLLRAEGADSYIWSPGASLSSTTDATVMASPSTTTTYTVSGTNIAGCTDTTAFTVIVNPLPVVIAPDDVTICIGTTVTLTASGAEAYTWEASLGLNTVVGESLVATPFQTSSYTVTGVSEFGCTASDVVTVTLDCNNVSKATLGVTIEVNTEITSTDLDNNDGKIFPNPTSGIVNIFPISSGNSTSISITDNLGQVVFETITNDNTSAVTVDLTEQAAGMYLVKIVNGATTLYEKIVKQ